MHLPATEKTLDRILSSAIPAVALVLAFGLYYNIRPRLPTVASHFSRSFRPPETRTDSDPSSSRNSQPESRPPSQPSLKASDHVNDGKFHLLLAATGSVATIKIPNILEALSKHDNLSVRVVLSESAAEFLQAQSAEQPSLDQIAKIKNVDGVYRDEDEWRKPWVRGDSILHIELRRWADLMVIAPLSANSLAKVAMGLSDNLVTSTVRAWDATGLIDTGRPRIKFPYGTKKGIMVAPAMNTAMWAHPVTAEHIKKLSNDWSVDNGGWFDLLRPIEKELACGDTGSGAMRDWREIVASIKDKLQLSQAENGQTGAR